MALKIYFSEIENTIVHTLRVVLRKVLQHGKTVGT